MSHRKVYSQGSIPFSWEDKPGVSKVTHHQECPIDIRIHALDLTSSSSTSNSPAAKVSVSVSASASAQDMKIPLPPCPLQPPRPHRSLSTKGLRWQDEDPFLVAYKECTKSVKSSGKLASDQSKKAVGSKLRRKTMTKSIFSCKNKNSCDVQENNMLKLSQLPPLPTDKIRVSRRHKQEFLRQQKI